VIRVERISGYPQASPILSFPSIPLAQIPSERKCHALPEHGTPKQTRMPGFDIRERRSIYLKIEASIDQRAELAAPFRIRGCPDAYGGALFGEYSTLRPRRLVFTRPPWNMGLAFSRREATSAP
jgi:hypothetical protein